LTDYSSIFHGLKTDSGKFFCYKLRSRVRIEKIRFYRICLLLFIPVLILLPQKTASSETIFSLKIIGITGHLKKNQNPHLYRIKVNKRGRLVAHLGIILSAEHFIYQEMVSVKLAQAFMLDCAFLPAGFTYLGLRLCGRSGPHTFAIGNGPTLFYRRSWLDLPGYNDEGLLRQSKNIQYRFFWYAGEVEYDYALTGKPDFSLGLIPGPPVFFTIAPGVRFK